MSVTGTVHLDVRKDDEISDRRAAGQLFQIPAGAKVVVFVGNRDIWGPYLIDHMREHVERLHFDITGSNVAAVQAWVTALTDHDMGLGRSA